MRRNNKPYGLTLFKVMGLVVLAAHAVGFAKQSKSINISGWTCATDYLRSQGKSVPVAYRDPGSISESVEDSLPLEIPCCAQNANIKGEVSLDVVIDPTGHVHCVRGVNGNPIALTSAVASIPQWHFHVYRKGGKPSIVIGQLILPYDFTKK